MKRQLFILSFFVFLLGPSALFAQKLIDDIRVIKVLLFVHQQKDLKKMVNQSARIKYRLRNNSKVFTGKLDDIKEGMMVVNGKEVLFNDCKMIGGRVFSEEFFAGGVLTGAGFATIVFGAALAGTNIETGAVVIAGGVIALITGLVLVTKVRKFNLDKGWEVHSTEVLYNLAE
ncbi:MAG: hypothetical protein MK207_06580 [Saprospiraceae bacterium]|nr:hypothetical protein [Saprospiraceae bacterium]